MIGVDDRLASRRGDDCGTGQFCEAGDLFACSRTTVSDQQDDLALRPRTAVTSSQSRSSAATVQGRLHCVKERVQPGKGRGAACLGGENIDGNAQMGRTPGVAQGGREGGGELTFQLVGVGNHRIVAGAVVEHPHDIHTVLRKNPGNSRG